MRSLVVLVANVVFLAAIAVYTMELGSSTIVATAQSESSSSSSPDIPITIDISEIPLLPDSSSGSDDASVTLHITLRNTSPRPITFLRWSTPIDDDAVAMGMFKLTSLSTNTEVPCLDLKINRKMPKDDTFILKPGHMEGSFVGDLAKMKPEGVVTKQVVITTAEVEIRTGERYRVQARGRWLGVWVERNDDGDGKYVMREEDGWRTGEFASNGIEVDVL